MLVNFKKLIRSFKRAGCGLLRATKEEQNFKIELVFAVFVFILAFFFKISFKETAILVLAVSLLLILELSNTVIERIIDVLKPRVHYYVAVVKDLMSAAVLIAGIAVFIVFLLIFWPYFFKL